MDAVQSELDEIELNISRIPPDKFTVQLRVRLANSDSDQILSPVPFELPANLGDAVDQPDVYGKLLGDALFAAEELRKKMSEVAGPKRDHPLRLRLLSDDEEIQRQRWEAICFDGQPLFDRRICLSRFLSPDAAPERPPLRPSLKALIFVASPPGIDRKADIDNPLDNRDAPPGKRPKLAPIDVARERELAEKNLKPIPAEFIGSPSAGNMEALAAKLEEGFDILYVVCHGSVGLGYPCLYMEENGAVAEVKGEDFAQRIGRLRRPPRLIVLASCQSAGDGEPAVASRSLTALGPLLARKGIPAVIAMQGFVAIKTAEIFAARFFAELSADGQVDRAVAEARASVSAAGRKDYWMPVLFSSSRTGCIFRPYHKGFEKDEDTPWDEIVERTKPECECVPVLGPDCLEPIWGSTREIAEWLAKRYDFPLEEHLSESLPAVAQYLRYRKIDPVEVGLLEYLRGHWNENVPAAPVAEPFLKLLQANDAWNKPELPKPMWKRLAEFARARRAVSALPGGPEDLHRLLARLPYTLYLTACADHLLEDALQEEGKQPKSGYPRWKQSLWPSRPDDQDENHWEPSEREPFVYHLLGDCDQPKSLVVTGEDFDDYMLSINTPETERFTPRFINSRLSESALLFLGFSLKDRAFQIVIRNTLRRVDQESRKAWVGAQLPPDNQGRYRSVQEARTYITRTATLKIYWGTTQDFIEEFGKLVRDDATLSEYLKARETEAGAA